MHRLVVTDGKPGGESAIELLQGEDVPRPDFVLELALDRLNEFLDDARCGWIAGLAVKQPYEQVEARGLERSGVVDLGVVDVDPVGGAVGRQRTQEGVDENVEGLPVVVTPFDAEAAVAVDEDREVRGDDFALVEDVGPLLEVADPQGIGVVVGPAAADFGPADAELDARGAGRLEVPVQGRGGDRETEFGFQEVIDRHMRAVGLIAFQGDGAGDHGRIVGAGLAAVGAEFTRQSLQFACAVRGELTTQRRERWLTFDAVGVQDLSFRQRREKRGNALGLDFAENHGPEQRAPEHGPLFILGSHGHLLVCRRGTAPTEVILAQVQPQLVAKCGKIEVVNAAVNSRSTRSSVAAACRRSLRGWLRYFRGAITGATRKTLVPGHAALRAAKALRRISRRPPRVLSQRCKVEGASWRPSSGLPGVASYATGSGPSLIVPR